MSDYRTRFDGMGCTMYKYKTDYVALMFKRTGKSYKTMVTTRKVQLPEEQVCFDEADHSRLWHRQLGHSTAD